LAIGHDGFAAMLAGLQRPLRVLLAEDNATNQLVFSKLIHGMRIALTIANNGREALAQMSRSTFDVVFMDMRMPEMDGLDATRAIRAMGGARGAIPIVALTANAFPDDVKACRDAGMDAFIPKPIRKKALIETLARLLADHALVVQAADGADEAHAPALPAPGRVMPSEAAPDAGVPVLDRVIFDELIEAISAEDVRAALAVFAAETAARLAILRRLSCDTDRARIEDEAHTLKGAAAIFGLHQLSQLAQTLERSARVIAPAEYPAILDRLDARFKIGRDSAERLCAAAAA
jgi:CheY-like chemotaxis protein/HPt (histidine-containing phosphotransfer) domain-containing protein